MSNNLQQFNFQSHALRMIIDENGEPWFIAMDIADILDYTDAQAMTRKLDDDEIQNRQIVGFGNRGVTVINESGLYSAVLTSQKPEAKTFKRWITYEVLPSIRKHGYYIKPDTQTQQASLPFDDMPEEFPPFQRVKPSLLIKLGKMSKSLAQAYLIECGVTPDYVQKQLSQLGDTAPVLGIRSEDSAEALAARFVADWQAQVIAAPFAPCLGTQALRLFHVWLQQNAIERAAGDNILMAALYRHPVVYSKRTRIARGKHQVQRQVLLIDGETPPIGLSFIDWLAESIAAMESTLKVLEAG